MSSAGNRLQALACNLLWLLSCLPGWLAFRLALLRPAAAQRRILRRIVRRNAGTDFGRRANLGVLPDDPAGTAFPPRDYDAYAASVAEIRSGRGRVLTREPVLLLQPTSGSTGGTKQIPYTRSLAREFQAALSPWIASLFLHRPSLLAGRQYWAISPARAVARGEPGAVPVGFADDAEYLGAFRRRLVRRLFCVPPEIGRVADPAAWEYLTLLFLVREANLRLISVWHPSFLTVLMRALPRHARRIADDIRAGRVGSETPLPGDLRQALDRRLKPDPRRAADVEECLRRGGTGRDLWPCLKLISCWTDGWAARDARELAAGFPGVPVQGKGLLSTEGVVTIPFGLGGETVCAIRSHVLEFADAADGSLRRVWELRRERRYSVVLTTGGGLYRYRTHDQVEVTGFLGRTPCLRFVSRDNLVCDLVGEKLHLAHVEDALAGAEREAGVCPAFCMLAPSSSRRGYVLFAEGAGAGDAAVRLRDAVERRLAANVHYAHARRIGQLTALRVFAIDAGAAEACRARLVRGGQAAGDIKLLALRSEADWETAFRGRYAPPP